MTDRSPQKITTFLMFEGQAEEALTFYLSLFDDAEVIQAQAGEGQQTIFTLAGQQFMCLDSSVEHGFSFTPSVSLFVQCESEEEITRLYNALIEGGEAAMPLGNYGFSRQYGWLNDRFGVSWQLNLA